MLKQPTNSQYDMKTVTTVCKQYCKFIGTKFIKCRYKAYPFSMIYLLHYRPRCNTSCEVFAYEYLYHKYITGQLEV